MYNGKFRILSIDLSRCVFCGRCVGIYPVEAIIFSTRFELHQVIKTI